MSSKKSEIFSWTDVTIIIPTFRPGNYLYECLLNLNNQTFSYKKFKVIIILNGEREPFYSKINNFIKEYLKFSVILEYSSKKGVSNARNMGLNCAVRNTLYISFLDDDDLVSNNYLENLYLTLNHSQKDIAVSNMKVFKERHHTYYKDYVSNTFDLLKNDTQSFSLYRYRRFLSSACAKLIPVKLIGPIRFNPNLSNGEDALFMFSISKNINSIFLSDSDCFYIRRIREQSASRIKRDFHKRIKLTVSIISAYLNCYILNFWRYNFIFLLSRIAATVKTFLFSK